MGAKPLVGIVVVAGNHLAQTAETLGHLAQRTTVPGELVVVDNGSTDKTGDFLARLPTQLGSLALRIVRQRGNIGGPAALNQGLSLTTAPYLVWLGDDVLVPPGWVEDFLNVFEEHPHVGVVGPISNALPGAQRRPFSYEVKDYAAFAASWQAMGGHQVVPADRLDGSCLMIRRTVLDAIGGLDPRMSPGDYADDDWVRRAQLAGFTAAMTTRVVVHRSNKEWSTGFLKRTPQVYERKWQYLGTGPSRPMVLVPPVSPVLHPAWRAVMIPNWVQLDSWVYSAMRALGQLGSSGLVAILCDPEVDDPAGPLWNEGFRAMDKSVRARVVQHVETYPWTEFLSQAAHPDTTLWRTGSPVEPAVEGLLDEARMSSSDEALGAASPTGHAGGSPARRKGGG